MASPPSATRADQPHLVSLVLQSKKALQHGEQLCSIANTLTNTSAQCALDVLALDAKVKWISEAVIEQLKVCFIVLNVFFYSPSHAVPVLSRSSLQAWQGASSTNVRNSTSRSAYVFVSHTPPRRCPTSPLLLLIYDRNGTPSVRNVPPPSIPSSNPSAHNSYLQGFTTPRPTRLFSGANIRSTRCMMSSTLPRALLRPFGRTSLRRSSRQSMLIGPRGRRCGTLWTKVQLSRCWMLWRAIERDSTCVLFSFLSSDRTRVAGEC